MPPPEGLSPIAIGFEWATRIMVMGATFALPALAGSWVDNRVGSKPLGFLAGMILGLVAGIAQLMRIARDSAKS